MSQPRGTIIVRCYNEAEHIGKLLHGVFQQTIDDIEVILVDSGSTDGTLEVANQYSIDEIVYIDPNEFSFGRALNYGIEAASAKYCVIASAHVYPRRDDWLECLLEKFTSEDIALVYGKQRGNEVTKFSERQVFRQWFPDHDIERQDHPFCNNANCAIRRDVWEEFPYDEQLTGLEDVDWAKRVQKEGYDISYASDAEIIHVHDETIREVYNRYRREAYAHAQILPGASFSIRDFLTMFLRNTFSDYAVAVRRRQFWRNLLDIPRFRFLQFWGTYRGFQQSGPITEKLRQRFFYPDTEQYPDRERTSKTVDEPDTKASDAADTAGNEIDYSDDNQIEPTDIKQGVS